MQSHVLREVFLKLYLPRGSTNLPGEQGCMEELGFFFPSLEAYLGWVSVQQEGAPGNINTTRRTMMSLWASRVLAKK